jgi:hypothetical protein
MQKLLSVVLLFFIIVSCKKSEIDVIDHNEPPPDNTVAAVTIENYITRTYILVLGREPDSAEFNFSDNLLSAGHLDSASRHQFVNAVFNEPDYLPNVYNENRINLLNNADTADFTNWIFLYQLFLSDSTYVFQWPIIQYEVDRLVLMRDAYGEFVSGIIKIDELHRRMCNNHVYDEINMGSANFVNSTFQNLINRNPTISEQNAGISMVDGNNAVLLLQSGNSKNDYLNIITHCNNYFESQVVFMYLKYLHRNPTSVEMSAGSMEFFTTGDYEIVQKSILTTDEFIGI